MAEPIGETVFITKYALSDGIREVAVFARDLSGGITVKWYADSGWNGDKEIFYGRDWHETHEGAALRANQMREAKIASHEKSIAKLRKLSFANPEHSPA